MNKLAIDIVSAHLTIVLENVSAFNDKLLKGIKSYRICKGLADDIDVYEPLNSTLMNQIAEGAEVDYFYDDKTQLETTVEDKVCTIMESLSDSILGVFDVKIEPSDYTPLKEADIPKLASRMENVQWHQEEAISSLPFDGSFIENLNKEADKFRAWVELTMETYPSIPPFHVCGRKVTIQTNTLYDGTIEVKLNPCIEHHKNGAHLTPTQVLYGWEDRNRSIDDLSDGTTKEAFGKVLTSALESLNEAKDDVRTYELLTVIGAVVPHYHINMLANAEHYRTFEKHIK